MLADHAKKKQDTAQEQAADIEKDAKMNEPAEAEFNEPEAKPDEPGADNSQAAVENSPETD